MELKCCTNLRWYEKRPTLACKLDKPGGEGRYRTAASLSCCGIKEFSEARCPKNSMLLAANTHFLGWAFKVVSRSHLKTSSKCLKCSSMEVEEMMMVSM